MREKPTKLLPSCNWLYPNAHTRFDKEHPDQTNTPNISSSSHILFDINMAVFLQGMGRLLI